jgi:hypothetical protein
MVDLELTLSPDDRRFYTLEGVGTLRLSFASRGATAETGVDSWRITNRRWWRGAMDATDAAGTAVGSFEPHTLRRGGTMRWDARELTLRPASRWRERYALADDSDRELVILDGKGSTRRPVTITVEDPGAIEPGLLLFAAFLVRGFAASS